MCWHVLLSCQVVVTGQSVPHYWTRQLPHYNCHNRNFTMHIRHFKNTTVSGRNTSFCLFVFVLPSAPIKMFLIMQNSLHPNFGSIISTDPNFFGIWFSIQYFSGSIAFVIFLFRLDIFLFVFYTDYIAKLNFNFYYNFNFDLISLYPTTHHSGLFVPCVIVDKKNDH